MTLFDFLQLMGGVLLALGYVPQIIQICWYMLDGSLRNQSLDERIRIYVFDHKYRVSGYRVLHMYAYPNGTREKNNQTAEAGGCVFCFTVG